MRTTARLLVAPAAVPGLVSLSSRAVRNARAAALAVASAIGDRLELTDDLAVEVDEPGRLRVLNREQSYAVLRGATVGRFAYIARADVPDVVPVNFLLDGDDVLIRSGPGPKLQAAERGELVAFEVDDIDSATRTGRSVVVHGRATRCSQHEEEALASRTDETPWAAGTRRHLIRIRPARVTGRSLT